MSSDIRDLISRMADELDYYRQLLSDDRREAHALATEARAALAAEVVGEDRWYPDFAGWLEKEMPEGTVIGDPLWWASKIATNLARWGRPAAPPAPEPGEVGELVLSLRETAAKLDDDWYHASARIMRSAAALLQQQAAPAPAVVPVAIPGEQWHEDDGACLWWRFPIEESPWSGDPRGDDWPGYHTHFTRIVCPLPQVGEGKA